MPLIFNPFVQIQPGGKINFGAVVFTRDKVIMNNSADNNSFNTGDGNIAFNTSNEPTYNFGMTVANTNIDDDLVD